MTKAFDEGVLTRACINVMVYNARAGVPMELHREVQSVVEGMIQELERAEMKSLRRVSFSSAAKECDGIENERDRLLVRWARTCAKHGWRGGFSYCDLTPQEVKLLKEATQDIFYRIYRHPNQCVPLLENGAGGMVIPLAYLINFMCSEINYLHSVF